MIRAYKEGKEELCNSYCESDFKHIRTIPAFSVDFKINVSVLN